MVSLAAADDDQYQAWGAISPMSVRYAKDWYDAEARRSKLLTLLTPRLDEELAGNIVTT